MPWRETSRSRAHQRDRVVGLLRPSLSQAKKGRGFFSTSLSISRGADPSSSSFSSERSSRLRPSRSPTSTSTWLIQSCAGSGSRCPLVGRLVGSSPVTRSFHAGTPAGRAWSLASTSPLARAFRRKRSGVVETGGVRLTRLSHKSIPHDGASTAPSWESISSQQCEPSAPIQSSLNLAVISYSNPALMHSFATPLTRSQAALFPQLFTTDSLKPERE